MTILFILLTGCEKEEVILESQNSLINQFQSDFDKTLFSKTIPFDFNVNWNTTDRHYSEELEVSFYEFSITPSVNTDIKNFNYQIDYKVIAIENEDNTYNYYIAKFFQKIDSNNPLIQKENISFSDTKDYTGLIHIIDKDNDMVFAKKLIDGKLKDDKLYAEKEFKKPFLLKRIAKDCTTVTVYHYTDWYTTWTDGDGVHMIYTGSRLNSVTTEESCETYWLPELYAGGGGGSGTYTNTEDEDEGVYNYCVGSRCKYEIEDVLEEKEILLDDSFKNIDKINCTFEQLFKTTSLKSLLVDFFGSDAEFDLTFKVVEDLECNNNPNDPVGCTTSPSYDYTDKDVTIAIDKDYINDAQTPTIFLAQTLVHEAIHANLILAVKELNGGVVPANTDFGTLYEEYRQKKNWQHQYMADKYIDIMAEALEDVHPLLDDQAFIDYSDSNTLWSWDDFYKELAWMGLYDTTKGEEHLQEDNYTINSNLYVNDTKVNSTKTPKCDE